MKKIIEEKSLEASKCIIEVGVAYQCRVHSSGHNYTGRLHRVNHSILPLTHHSYAPIYLLEHGEYVSRLTAYGLNSFNAQKSPTVEVKVDDIWYNCLWSSTMNRLYYLRVPPSTEKLEPCKVGDRLWLNQRLVSLEENQLMPQVESKIVLVYDKQLVLDVNGRLVTFSLRERRVKSVVSDCGEYELSHAMHVSGE